MAVRVDLDRLATIGQPAARARRRRRHPGQPVSRSCSVSDTGTLAYLTQTAAVASPRQLVWLDRSGQPYHRSAMHAGGSKIRGSRQTAERLRSLSAMRTTPTFGPMTCRAVPSVASPPRRQRSSARSGRLTAVVSSSCSRSLSFISTRTLSMALAAEPARVLDGPYGPDSALGVAERRVADLYQRNDPKSKGGRLGGWD